MERNTFQKQVILDYLCSTKIHPSAEKVHKEVKKIIPTISKGTVYRVLNNFVSQGKIQEIQSGISHYDADLSGHAHFICEGCGQIIDINQFPSLKYKNKNPAFQKAGVSKINNYQLCFFGICKKCES